MRKLITTQPLQYALHLECEACGFSTDIALKGNFSSEEIALAVIPKHHWEDWYLCHKELCPTCYEKAKSIGRGHLLPSDIVETLKKRQGASSP